MYNCIDFFSYFLTNKSLIKVYTIKLIKPKNDRLFLHDLLMNILSFSY